MAVQDTASFSVQAATCVVYNLSYAARIAARSKGMILVVDHDPEVLEQAQKILNRDRQVFLASTAAKALEMVERLGFSVVLVDLELTGDGYALIQKIHDSNPDLLIIGVKGAMKASVQHGCARADKLPGVVEYLEKPITPAWRSVVERIRSRGRAS